MKAGSMVFNRGDLPDMNRGELQTFLCDAIEAALGIEETDRDSNGFIADTLYRFLDIAVVTPIQEKALCEFLDTSTCKGEF